MNRIIESLEKRQLFAVTASIETTPVPHSGDSADDVAIWVHPTNSSQSIIIGTDKDSKGGLLTYDLNGKQLAFYQHGKFNNVDLEYNYSLNGQSEDIVVASNRSGKGSLAIYKVDKNTKALTNIAARTLSTTMNGGVYGLTLYRSPTSSKLYAFVSARNNGEVEQWELFDNGSGKIDGKVVRKFNVGSTSEAMVVDDANQVIYIGEENIAIWKYGAEPTSGTSRTQVDKTGSGGHLTADVEGLAIYNAANGTGYILASSQGSNDFTVYNRTTNAYIGRFKISSGVVDAVTSTDGIEVTSVNLGGGFSKGLFVAQDGSNSGNQNFKLVPWEHIASELNLIIDTSVNPRGGSTVPQNPEPIPEKPTVTVQVTDADGSEDGSDVEFDIIRTGDLTNSLTVNLQYGGTASTNDYNSISSVITIPAGQSRYEVQFLPINDSVVEGNETIVVTIKVDDSYNIGTPNSAIGNIKDNDTSTQPPPPPPPTEEPIPNERPGPTNTGPTNSDILKTINGNLVIRESNVVVENVRVNGYIYVYGKNVTIRNFIVNSGSIRGIKVFEEGSALIEHGEIIGNSKTGSLLSGYNFTARYLNIHHSGQDGIHPRRNCTVEYNWVHHIGLNPDSHADGIQLVEGHNLIVRNNFFDIPKGIAGTKSNAAIFLKEDNGPIFNILIDNNWMNGGNYTIYSRDVEDLVITNNFFGRDYKYGIKSIDDIDLWSNNRYLDNNQIINL